MDSEEIKKAGLKITTPRIKILQVLENSKERHMNAENVYKALIEADEEVGWQQSIAS
jgi:Fur family ferric uptake transcriptional regulator